MRPSWNYVFSCFMPLFFSSSVEWRCASKKKNRKKMFFFYFIFFFKRREMVT